MTNQVLIKRSAIPAKVPATTDLALGELAINTNDGKLFLKQNNGSDAIVEVGAVKSVAGRTGSVVLATSDVAESTNLYFTSARASAAAPVQTVAGRTGAVVLAVADVSGAAPLASPALTGTPTAPTTVTSDNSTLIATTAFVKAQGYTTAAAASAAAPVQSVFGRTGAVTLASSDVTTALGYTPADNAKLAQANGIATLDASGKLPIGQLTSAVVGAVVYQGTWNASTNTPTLTSGTGTKGQYYKVSVAGSTSVDGLSQWNIGDTIIFNGTTWDKLDGLATEVSSVAGRVGAVVLSVADVSGAAPLASPTFTGTSTFDIVVTTSNGLGTNVKVGDDAWIGDVNLANGIGIKGQAIPTTGYVRFGSGGTFGYDGSNLVYGGTTVITTSGSGSTLSIVDTGANGANFKLTGNGATTPNKFIRALGGNLEFVNSGYAAVMATFNDNGSFTAGASVNAGTTMTAYSLGNLGQYNAVYGSGSSYFNASMRNDGTSVYFLSSNSQSTPAAAGAATFNALRPFQWNLTSGYVFIDQTGAGTSFGGQVTAPFVNTGVAATVAAAGATQGTGTVLATSINVITSGAGGVVLPVGVAGMLVTVINTTGAAINIYPAAGSQIDVLGVNTAFSLGTTAKLEFVAISATQWYALTAVLA
jgi:hypothetical protein